MASGTLRTAALAALLLAWAGAAFGQSPAIDRMRLAPPPNPNLVPLQIAPLPPSSAQTPTPPPAPATTEPLGPASTEAPAPIPLMSAPPGSGGTLIGSPLPPPPAVPQTAGALKEDVTIEPGEVAVMSASLQDAQQVQQRAQALGMAIKRRAVLGNLGLVISVLRVPRGVSVASALAQLRQAMPAAWFDANHRYSLEGGPAVIYGPKLVGWPAAPAQCGGGAKIGMIDTPVDLGNPAFEGGHVMQRSFLPAGVTAAPADHGTAIASLLVGSGVGLMPGGALRAAAVFRLRGEHGADTTAELVARALDWLVGQHVEVINLSFGGPRDQIVEAAILRVEQRGVAVVAAAGNGGADAPPVYPAAQPGVIGVTAVDSRLGAYAHANHGDYIAFAAPGVDVWTAAPGAAGKYESGTSYAVPFATAVLAAAKDAQPAASWDAIEKALQAHAKDLGPPGKDPTFGWGLIQAPGGCANAAR